MNPSILICRVQNKFGNDPLYNNVITAKNTEDQNKAIELLRSIRGKQSYKNLCKFIQSFNSI